MTIRSGGQTGVDRSALTWAIRRGVPHGGWCPKGRRAEDGRIPARYQLDETPSPEYLQRTEWNVRDSDATVIFTSQARLEGGTAQTAAFCARHRKPLLILASEILTVAESAALLRRFLRRHRLRVLNVAGPRASTDRPAGAFARAVLEEALCGPPSS